MLQKTAQKSDRQFSTIKERLSEQSEVELLEGGGEDDGAVLVTSDQKEAVKVDVEAQRVNTEDDDGFINFQEEVKLPRRKSRIWGFLTGTPQTDSDSLIPTLNQLEADRAKDNSDGDDEQEEHEDQIGQELHSYKFGGFMVPDWIAPPLTGQKRYELALQLTEQNTKTKESPNRGDLDQVFGQWYSQINTDRNQLSREALIFLPFMVSFRKLVMAVAIAAFQHQFFLNFFSLVICSGVLLSFVIHYRPYVKSSNNQLRLNNEIVMIGLLILTAFTKILQYSIKAYYPSMNPRDIEKIFGVFMMLVVSFALLNHMVKLAENTLDALKILKKYRPFVMRETLGQPNKYRGDLDVGFFEEPEDLDPHPIPDVSNVLVPPLKVPKESRKINSLPIERTINPSKLIILEMPQEIPTPKLPFENPITLIEDLKFGIDLVEGPT